MTTTEAVHDPALDALVDAVRAARPHLIDEWEATAVIESLGYTDARIRRELGFTDTAALGVYVFSVLSGRPAETIDVPGPRVPPPLLQLIDSVGASLVYALPWLVVFLLERVRPEALRLPAGAGPPLSL